MNTDSSTIYFASNVFLTAENKILEAYNEINKIINNNKNSNTFSLGQDMLQVSKLQGKIKAWKELEEYIVNGMFYMGEGCVS